MNQIILWELNETDKFVACAPLSHGSGTYILPLLAQGGSIVVCESTELEAIQDAFEVKGGTLSFMPPTLIYKLIEQVQAPSRSFHSLRLLIYGGAGMPVEKINQAQQFFGPVLATTYGQTEAPQIVTAISSQTLLEPQKKGSVGKASYLTDIAIVDAEGKHLHTNEMGEILVRGSLVMTGYWQLKEKTAETIRNGWLHTGDVGYLDEEGYLFIKDRIRDVIITGGFNIYPLDVENCLAAHPEVHEVTVFGLSDEKWGETVNAAIQLNGDSKTSIEEFKQFVKDRLGPVSTPKQIFIYDLLPKSTVGKILKKELQLNHQ